jgi:hypothetical protein
VPEKHGASIFGANWDSISNLEDQPISDLMAEPSRPGARPDLLDRSRTAEELVRNITAG